ncbi:endonuclease/exonuclease/phosphatase family protein [Lacibacterium aquatile]|uniref:Endonuclease/exonuclease/phosphatase family protein n=1 Tax=Lacibacterium aquatile TaxID=1168082 RepID=A0ABW5DU47_9PROT
MRIFSWNIHAGIGPDRRYDLSRIIDLIRGHEPDIIALQEVDSRGRRAEEAPLTALKQGLGDHAAEARTIAAPDGHYGHVLISRWPMREIQLHDLSVGRREPRCAIDAQVQTPLGTLRVIATHLGLGRGERNRQIDTLRALLSGSQQPTILLGDFNDWDGSVRRRLADLLPSGTGHRTFPAWRPLLRLDRVHVDRQVTILKSWVDPAARQASDHLPVIADIAQA